ncbi:MAG: hypothetical protein M4579_000260 [Chaenotheca gracillima]|nr:MAG: hypothetical protein M4579_000260 [Chaenotheca gracillima]
MAPRVPSAKATLSYPLFSVDFDPLDSQFLLVGGGGGEGRSGVGNKITLLGTGSQSELAQLGEAELSRDEDSVTSLAIVRRSSADAVLALAGINSSTVAQETGKNEHLRNFAINYPPRRERTIDEVEAEAESSKEPKPVEIAELSRASLFAPSSSNSKETYQRILRLSTLRQRDNSAPRLGAIATGLAPEGEAEIVLFDTKAKSVTSRSVVGRISLKDQEAADVDIIESGDGEYQVAYCIDYEAYIYKPGQDSGASKDNPELANPKPIYIIPFPDTFAYEHSRPHFRALRFLTPSLVLMVQNYAHRSGVELLVVKLGKGMGEVIRRKRLHRSMKAAVSLDVSVLDDNKGQEKQFVVAVAGQDISIALLTLKYSTRKGLGKFKSYAVLRNVHPVQITKICFSNFIPPSHPISSATLPQYLKLASVSMGNTVIVHTFPLVPIPFRSKTPHYVLSSPSQTPRTALAIVVALLATVFSAFIFQAFVEIRGGTPPYLGAVDYLHPRVSKFMARPYVMDTLSTTTVTVPAGTPKAEIPAAETPVADAPSDEQDMKPDIEKLQELRQSLGEDAALILKHGPDGVNLDLDHTGKQAHKHGKSWEDLAHDERARWRERLGGAAGWTLEEGQAILKGIVFSEVGAQVGQAAAAAAAAAAGH